MIKRYHEGMLASGCVGISHGTKTTQSGKQYATFSIAADRRDNETVWVNCKAWGNLSLIASRLQKGDCVLVTGRYEEREHEGKVYKTLVADCIVGGAVVLGDAAEPTGGYAENTMTEDGDELPF